MTTVIVLMSGLRNISYLRFGIHTAIAIGLWVIFIGDFGYLCGEAMINNINALSENKWMVIGPLVLIGILVWFFRHRPIDKECLTVAP